MSPNFDLFFSSWSRHWFDVIVSKPGRLTVNWIDKSAQDVCPLRTSVDDLADRSKNKVKWKRMVAAK